MSDVAEFQRLHPSLQHHVVNTLGWSTLRPVQLRCIGPILDGKSLLVLAPTAGGKTEAAVLPLLSRALTEGWLGLSILYVCPLKALLNNLLPRLERYCSLVGRRCGIWHGDVEDGARRSMVQHPPDLLLTTPESLEVILAFRHRRSPGFITNVRAVVVDELHAFAGDDRGWHLLSVIERLEHLGGRPLQRIGLSATVGNAHQLGDWLACEQPTPRDVIDATDGGRSDADVTVDYVGSLENAATVIAALHAGEKRLVFCDSRSRVEQLAGRLRDHEIDTFVSHSSLSADERRSAEQAFAERGNCVIVATSTLELGIDVGDLDRVIQVDAPGTVASFLQRIGRTGRRRGGRRNCLFLATTEAALLQATALVELWQSGFVEPVRPPPLPLHIFAQQVMALALQLQGVAEDRLARWIGRVPGFGSAGPLLADVVNHMLASGILTSDAGLLWFGEKGESEYGRRNFIELLSSFTSPPLFRVQHGQREIGTVDQISFAARSSGEPVILLAGRNWQVTHLDWNARVAYVVPTHARGRSQWMSAGPPLSYALCQSMRRVLASREEPAAWSRRTREAMERLRDTMLWCEAGQTSLVSTGDASRWWTFGGFRANLSLAEAIQSASGYKAVADNLYVDLHADLQSVLPHLAGWAATARTTPVPVASLARAVGQLKFDACLPAEIAAQVLWSRLQDLPSVERILAEPIR